MGQHCLYVTLLGTWDYTILYEVPRRKRRMRKPASDSIPVKVLETLSRREEEHCPDTLRVSGIYLKSVPEKVVEYFGNKLENWKLDWK